MYAFIKTAEGLYKIYDKGDDWQVVGPNGFERWFSVYTDDKRASFNKAVSRIPGAEIENLVITPKD